MALGPTAPQRQHVQKLLLPWALHSGFLLPFCLRSSAVVLTFNVFTLNILILIQEIPSLPSWPTLLIYQDSPRCPSSVRPPSCRSASLCSYTAPEASSITCTGYGPPSRGYSLRLTDMSAAVLSRLGAQGRCSGHVRQRNFFPGTEALFAHLFFPLVSFSAAFRIQVLFHKAFLTLHPSP